MKLGFDIDGCFANFNTPYAKLLADENGSDLLPDGWESNPEVFCTWHWDHHYGYPSEIQSRVMSRHILGSRKFWERLPSIEGAAETLRKLNFLSKDHDVYFLTNRMGTGSKTQTEKWLYMHGFDYPTVLLASDKIPIIKALDLGFYIDDKLDTMTGLCEQDWAKGRAFYLQEAPWNKAGRPEELRVTPSVKGALIEAGIWR